MFRVAPRTSRAPAASNTPGMHECITEKDHTLARPPAPAASKGAPNHASTNPSPVRSWRSRPDGPTARKRHRPSLHRHGARCTNCLLRAPAAREHCPRGRAPQPLTRGRARRAQFRPPWWALVPDVLARPARRSGMPCCRWRPAEQRRLLGHDAIGRSGRRSWALLDQGPPCRGPRPIGPGAPETSVDTGGRELLAPGVVH